jgi:alkanesulfonate monooxygenase SsuD/methylene tetrahydromethanopterin reductase-like flavin-dependent oxidoreductase (luciferase family)
VLADAEARERAAAGGHGRAATPTGVRVQDPSGNDIGLRVLGWARPWASVVSMPLRLGVFVVPDATDHETTVEAIVAADRSGLDLVGVQDHPYQRRFFDTWTLLSYVAARTERVRLLPDVINLPLRLPSVLAKSAASLDVLSGGRVELGVGAGAFWDGIAAMGGPRLGPKESVDALEEAIEILRGFWSGERSVIVRGQHHRVEGARPGPPPAHPIGIWVGGYGPRMLRLTGRLGDGWLPSLGYMKPEDAPRMQAAVDEGARAAGRDPCEIERALNVMALEGDPGVWADRLAGIVTDLGFSTLLVGLPGEDPVGTVRRLGEEVAPRVRELAGDGVA